MLLNSAHMLSWLHTHLASLSPPKSESTLEPCEKNARMLSSKYMHVQCHTVHVHSIYYSMFVCESVCVAHNIKP